MYVYMYSYTENIYTFSRKDIPTYVCISFSICVYFVKKISLKNRKKKLE